MGQISDNDIHNLCKFIINIVCRLKWEGQTGQEFNNVFNRLRLSWQ